MLQIDHGQQIELWLGQVPVKADYYQYLMQQTKESLDGFRRIWELKGISHLNKGPLAQAIAEQIPEHLSQWAVVLTEKQLRTLEKLVACQGILNGELTEPLLSLLRRGLVFPGVIDDVDVWAMPQDLVPHIADLISDPRVRQGARVNTQALQLARGMLVLYGVASCHELLTLVQEHLPEMEDFRRFFELLYEVHLNDGGINFADGKFAAAEVRNPEEIAQEQAKRPLLAYKPVAPGLLRDIATKGHLPWTPHQKTLAERLRRCHGISVDEVEAIMIEAWYQVNNDVSMVEMNQWLVQLVGVNSFDQMSELLLTFTEFVNHTPQWILKGHTPQEVGTTLGPGFSPNSGSGKSMSKVGRNDPCPCGSGQKYKYCCGRG